MSKFSIIYDTYCGWCYGAHEVLGALVQSDHDVEMLHRQLFTFEHAHKMSDGFGQMALRYDARIQQLTGQPFSDAYKTKVLMSDTEVLDSGLTGQAAALVHDMGPRVEFALASKLQSARFVDGMSAADTDHIIDALVALGVDRKRAVDHLGTPQLRDAAEQLSTQARAKQQTVGEHGVPVVILERDGRRDVVNLSQFYQKPATVLNLAA